MPSFGRFVAFLMAFAASALAWPVLANERTRGSDSALQSCLEKANSSDPLMKDCYAEFAGREDMRLNSNWKRLMAAVDGDIRLSIIDEQRAWLKFRDASCVHYSFGAGTLDRLMGTMCYANLISDRADQLEALAHYYDYQ